MSKNEMIWCVGRKKLFDNGYFHGFIAEDLCDFSDVIFTYREYKDRVSAETDETFKQPITYIVVLNSTFDKVFGYIRQGNEQRLADKWSLGFGGHVNKNDLTFTTAVIRESEEELDIQFNRLSICHEGYINLDTSPVNRVHFGLVYKAVVRDGFDLRLKGSENKSGMWLSADELDSMQFEDWSEIIKPVVKGWLRVRK